MEVKTFDIEGPKLIVPDVYRDPRGYFQETYSEGKYRDSGICETFVQDNESGSGYGVLRGLHWQAAPHTQAKLVRVIRGAVWDVAVDIRAGSTTYGKHVSCVLSAENKHQFYIPRGFAHGFVVLEDDTLFSYKCDIPYCREAERGVRFDDPALGIEWPKIEGNYVLSDKDLKHPSFDLIEPWRDSDV